MSKTNLPKEELLRQTLETYKSHLDHADFKSALKALNRAVDLAPGNAEILSHRGRVKLFLHDVSTAQDDFTEALKCNPNCALAFSGLARLHFDSDNFVEAEFHAFRALGLDPADDEAAAILRALKARSKTSSPQATTDSLFGPTPSVLALSRVKSDQTSLRPEFLLGLVRKFGIKSFIETGTFMGDTAAMAATIVAEVHTIELSSELARQATQRFSAQPQVQVHEGDSAKLLPKILATAQGPALLWLDGHYSEGVTARGDSNTPVLAELQAVQQSGLKDAVILIDDLRLFQTPLRDVASTSSLHGYPSIQELHQAVLAIDAGYQFFVLGDIAIAFPNQAELKPSSVVMAMTISRIYDGQNLSLDEIFEAENVIAQAVGEEREAIRALPRAHAAVENYGLGLHYRFWHGLNLFGEKKSAEAAEQFASVIALGFSHWRVHWYRALALVAANQPAPAREILDHLSKHLPDFLPVQKLREEIHRAASRTTTPTLSSSADALPALQAAGIWRPGQPLRLHLGCGENHFDGYVNIDYPPSEHTCQTKIGADIFADITSLVFPAQSVDEIRLHHVFEHFTRPQSLALLIRWHESLKVGGKLHIETPDVMGCAEQLVSNISYRLKQAVLRHCFGSHEAHWANHYDGWHAEKYSQVLTRLGFRVECHRCRWTQEPHLANVHAHAFKVRHLTRAELLAATDAILEESMVAQVASERGMWEVWRKDLRSFLSRDSQTSATTSAVAALTTAVNQTPKSGQIVVKLQGGLGNQMFQYAAGLALARRTNARLKLDLSFLLDQTPRKNFTQRDYCLDLFHLAADCEVVPDASSLAKSLRCHTEHQYHFDPAFNQFGSDIYLDGYFQSPRFFEPVRDEVVRTFQSFATPLNAEQRALAEKIKSVSAVCLNVRRGDYVANPVTNQFHGVCDENYFHRAVAEILQRVPDAHFFVFSDDVEWCRSANLTNGAPTTLVPHQFAGDRFGAYLQLMSACRHFILPNSSFGWWAAFLGAASDKIVIVPTPWFDNPLNNTVDLLPADWIRLPKNSNAGPVVSVVISCHNYAKYLPEAVTSVWNQTYRRFEIIIVDDGSSDDSSAVAQRLAAEISADIPVRVFHLEDVGPAASRRFGIAQAHGKFYLPLDADDRIAPDFLAKTVPLLEADAKLGFVYVDQIYFGDAERLSKQPEYDFARLCRENYIGCCSLIRKAAFDAVNGYDPENWGYYEDWDLWIRLGAKGWFGKHLGEPLFFYRHHFNSSLSLFACRLDPIYKAFLHSRHPDLYSATVVADAQKILSEMPAGWHSSPPMREVKRLQALLEQHPDNRHVQYFLGCALGKQGQLAEAEATFKKLLSQHPEDIQAQEALKQLTAPPASSGPGSDIVAIIAAYNEGDVIYPVLRDLIENGIKVYFIDNASTDNTCNEVRRLLGKGVIKIERFPADSGAASRSEQQYVWRDILRRKTEIAKELNAAWYIHADADEFRASPWPGLSLAEAIRRVDALGYNALRFELLNFRPVDDAFVPGSDVRTHLKYYEEAEVFNSVQIKAWKNTGQPVDLASSGGHQAEFAGRKVCPIPFLHLHYPIRSETHGRQKVLLERLPRFTAEERADGWHVQYDCYAAGEAKFLKNPADLALFDPLAARLKLMARALQDPLLAAALVQVSIKSQRLQNQTTAAATQTCLESVALPAEQEAVRALAIKALNADDCCRALTEYNREQSRKLVQANTVRTAPAEPTEVLQPRAAALFEAANWHEAGLAYLTLANRLPNDLGVWRNRLECSRQQGHTVMAKIIREEALEKHPEWAVQLDTPFNHSAAAKPTMTAITPSQPQSGKAPKVAIIIPVFNKVAFTRKCLKALKRNTPAGSYEVIVWDNGSTDETQAFVQQQAAQDKAIRYFRSEKNLGFVGGNNAAAQEATSEFLVLLNNDTEPQPGWLEALLQTVETDASIGAVGAKLIYPDGKLQEAGGIIFSDASGWNYGRTQDPRDPRFNFLREVDYCSAACLLVRATLFQKLGGFDARYAPAYYEDTDLCFALRDLGHRVVYQPRSEIIHHEGATAGQDLAKGFKQYQVTNRQKFFEKWRAALARQAAPDASVVRRASQRATGQRILVIDPLMPMYDRASGSKRLFEMLKLLAAAGHAVTFIARNGQGGERYTAELQQLGIEVYAGDVERMKECGFNVTGWPLDLKKLLHETQYDLVVFSFWYIAEQYLACVRAWSPKSRVVIDTVDVHFLRERRQAELYQNSTLKQEAEETYRRELGIYRQADALITVTENDRQALLAEIPGSRIFIVPNIHDVAGETPSVDGRNGCLFVGGFSHLPNADAVLYFHREIWPRILQRVPDARWTIVGNNPPPAVQALAGPAIQVTGYVPSVEPYLRSHLISVAPLRYGAGMKGKIGEALAHGLPVVTTTIGAEGMGLQNGDGGTLVADDPEAFAVHVARLCADRDFWQQLSAGGRQHIESHFTPQCIARQLETMLEWSRSFSSIILLAFNQWEHTEKCLVSLARYTPEPHEVILVDNGSTDKTPEALRKLAARHPRVRVIFNRGNRGFAAGNNQALAIAGGKVVVLLNNDTVVTPGWLGRMLAVFQRQPVTGIVGPMSNCVSGPQLVEKVGYADLTDLPAFAEQWAAQHAGQTFEVGRAVGFCLAARREVIEKIGGLDECFGNGNFEDDDFCIRARLAGFQVQVAKDVFIHHTGSQSFKGAKINYRDAMLKNWELFRTKWRMSAAVTLETGYPFPKTLPAGTELKIALPNLELTHAANQQNCWTQNHLSPATPIKREIPAIARLGNLDQAKACFGRREYQEAWKATTDAIAKRPFHPEAFLLLAEIALAAGDGKTAKLCAQRARAMAPDWKLPKQFLTKPLKGDTKSEWLDLSHITHQATRLTVCLIAKNEEKFLAQCLQSVHGLASQIVVLDTGSTDRTVEIAREHGAEVHSLAWADDFSAARNAVLEHATGDWILMLDADEELPAAEHAKLLADMKNDGVVAFRLPLVNRGQENEGRSFVPRLFRNLPGVFFQGRIHEQVFKSLLPSAKKWGLKTELGTAELLHHGYTKELIRDRNKIERNLNLLRQATQEDPTDANLVMNFGLELVRAGELDAGIAKYREAFELMSAPNVEIVPELREVLLTQFVCQLYKVRGHKEVVQVLNSPLAKTGGLTASLHFSFGLSLFELKEFAAAAEQMRFVLAKRNQPALTPINLDIHTAAPQHCLALCLARKGDMKGAEKAFSEAIAANGRTSEARVDFAKFLLEQNRITEALQDLHAAISADPQCTAAWRLGGEIALRSAEFLEFANEWTGEAFKALPENPVIAAQRAEALMLNGDVAAAAVIWEKIWRSEPDARPLAALILCETMSTTPPRALRAGQDEAATSTAFIVWYQKLIAVRAQALTDRLNEQLETLAHVLPTAAQMLQTALAEANVPV